jgi:alpha-tubulin suppressor-like RCC1 family protein
MCSGNACKWTRVRCGRLHSLLRCSRCASLSSFGSGNQGALGVGGSSARLNRIGLAPVDVPGECGEIQCFDAGWMHSLASDGRRSYAWGNNIYGQLGVGDLMNRLRPAEIESLRGEHVTLLAGGLFHSMAAIGGSELVAWGTSMTRGTHLLGTDAAPRIAAGEPMRIDVGGDVRSIGVGRAHSVAALADGRLMAWGSNEFGQLGLGDREARVQPTLVSALAGERIVRVECGSDHTLALDDRGRLHAFGTGSDGQLASTDDESSQLSPALIGDTLFDWPDSGGESLAPRIVDVAAGQRHTLAIVDYHESQM